jgi:lipoate-protein ligase A
MKLLDLTLATPADNLACDEALLNWCESGDGGQILRFWEPREYFVVVGYANKVDQEVNVAACRARNFPIFRRCSGGGTVLQGPGSLNYALILDITECPHLANISSVNKFIMERNATAIESELGSRIPGVSVSVRGHTDLALATGETPGTLKKFSGNSQRRHKRALLFHGTFLLHLDFALMAELLLMPSQQPDYRRHRSHTEFLTNLDVPASRVKDSLCRAWKVTGELPDFPARETSRLAAEKYSAPEWNFKS